VPTPATGVPFSFGPNLRSVPLAAARRVRRTSTKRPTASWPRQTSSIAMKTAPGGWRRVGTPQTRPGYATTSSTGIFSR
jgi:hypothetical protein